QRRTHRGGTAAQRVEADRAEAFGGKPQPRAALLQQREIAAALRAENEVIADDDGLRAQLPVHDLIDESITTQATERHPETLNHHRVDARRFEIAQLAAQRADAARSAFMRKIFTR